MRQVNLLPEDVRPSDGQLAVKCSLAAAGLVFVLLLWAVHALLAARIDFLKKSIAENAADAKAAKSGLLDPQLAGLKAEKKALLSDEPALAETLAKDYVFPNILKKLGDIAVDRVYFTGVAVNSKNGVCEIAGKAYNTRLVSEFMLELKKLSYCETLDLSEIEKKAESPGREIDFKIVCKLR